MKNQSQLELYEDVTARLEGFLESCQSIKNHWILKASSEDEIFNLRSLDYWTGYVGALEMAIEIINEVCLHEVPNEA